MVNQVEVITETTIMEYIAYAAFGLSVLNFILCCCLQCLRLLPFEQGSSDKSTSTVSTTPPHKICKRCDKLVQHSQQSKISEVPRARTQEGTNQYEIPSLSIELCCVEH